VSLVDCLGRHLQNELECRTREKENMKKYMVSKINTVRSRIRYDGLKLLAGFVATLMVVVTVSEKAYGAYEFPEDPESEADCYSKNAKYFGEIYDSNSATTVRIQERHKRLVDTCNTTFYGVETYLLAVRAAEILAATKIRDRDREIARVTFLGCYAVAALEPTPAGEIGCSTNYRLSKIAIDAEFALSLNRIFRKFVTLMAPVTAAHVKCLDEADHYKKTLSDRLKKKTTRLEKELAEGLQECLESVN
jgi:hypothetical protein